MEFQCKETAKKESNDRNSYSSVHLEGHGRDLLSFPQPGDSLIFTRPLREPHILTVSRLGVVSARARS